MMVTDEQYETFVNEVSDVRERLWKLGGKIGNVPMTKRFIQSVYQICADLMQMYFEEIKGEEEKAVGRKIVRLYKGNDDERR